MMNRFKFIATASSGLALLACAPKIDSPEKTVTVTEELLANFGVTPRKHWNYLWTVRAYEVPRSEWHKIVDEVFDRYKDRYKFR